MYQVTCSAFLTITPRIPLYNSLSPSSRASKRLLYVFPRSRKLLAGIREVTLRHSGGEVCTLRLRVEGFQSGPTKEGALLHHAERYPKSAPLTEAGLPSRAPATFLLWLPLRLLPRQEPFNAPLHNPLLPSARVPAVLD